MVRVCVWVLGWLVVALLTVSPGSADDGLATAHARYLRETKGILDIRALQRSGDGRHHVDVVIVSAGFTAEQGEVFHQACDRLVKSLFSGPTWAKFRKLVNVHSVLIGDESADVTRMKVHGYKGHVLGCDNAAAIDYAGHAADPDATIVLHNSGYSTAGTGPWGVVVINLSNVDGHMTVTHELGHGFAGLGDEYIQRSEAFDGDAADLEETTVNVTPYADPKRCKWHYWTEPEWPGPFGPIKLASGVNVANVEGAGWVRGIYRPEEGCAMKCNLDRFCAVCNEGMESNFFRYVDLFPVVTPTPGDVVLWQGESVDFRVRCIDLLREPPGWLASRLTLYREGEKVAASDRGEVSYAFRTEGLKPGVYHLGANVHVQTDATRRDFGFMSRSRSWRVVVLPHARPVISVPSEVSVAPDGELDVPVQIAQADAGQFSLRMTHDPDGAVLEDGRFRWKPNGKTGSWKVDFHACDPEGRGVTESMVICVASDPAGEAAIDVTPLEPVVAITGKAVNVALKATAADAGHMLFEPVQVPEGVEVNRETGDVSWTPPASLAGPHAMRFLVKNGRFARECGVTLWVHREAKPTPVSYASSYKPRTVADLADLKHSPLVYHRLFETLRLMRDRYAVIHRQALADMQTLYAELDPSFRGNCLEELHLRAWEFADRPAVLRWMREVAAAETSETSRLLVEKLDAIDRYNVAKLDETKGKEQPQTPERAEVLVR